MERIRHTHAILALWGMLALGGCAAGDDAPEASVPPLVVEAWIDSGGFPTAILTRPIIPSSDPQPLEDAVIRWGKVTLTDGEETDVLSGGRDPGVFPPYSYTSFGIRGRLGGTYTITAEYKGDRATCTATIPEVAPTIEGVDFTPIAGSDTLMSARLRYGTIGITVHPDLVIFTQVHRRDLRRYAAFMGAPEAIPDRAGQSAPLYRGHNYDDAIPFEADFVRGDLVTVTLARVNPEAYTFWRGYIDRIAFGNSMFFDPVIGEYSTFAGAYGCFTAAATATITIRVPVE